MSDRPLLSRLWADALAWFRGFNHEGVTEANPVVLPRDVPALRIRTSELPILADTEAVVQLHEWVDEGFTEQWNRDQLDTFIRRREAELAAIADLEQRRERQS